MRTVIVTLALASVAFVVVSLIHLADTLGTF